MPHNGCMPTAIRVLVADDQRLVREGFRVLIDSEPDLEVVAEASDGHEAVRQAALARPDVVLMDIRMPGLDGLGALDEIMRMSAPPRVVMLTTFGEDAYVVRALRSGAYGFLLKDAPASRLVAAVRAAAIGESLIEPAITRRLVERYATPARPPAQLPPALLQLTDREQEVLHALARGLSNAEIAAELVVAETTVKTHVARILTKLDVRDRVQAVVLAHQSGFVWRRVVPEHEAGPADRP